MKRWNNPLIPEVFHMDHQALKDQHLEWLEWISPRDLDRFFSIPAAMGRSPVLEEIRNLETKIREKNNTNAVLVVVCLNFLRESWFFIREPAVN